MERRSRCSSWHWLGRRFGGLCSATLLASCSAADANQQTPSPAPTPAEVMVVTLHSEPVALQTELVGRTAPFRSAEVRPQVTGIIKSRLFREGANVREGETLYQIDPSVY